MADHEITVERIPGYGFAVVCSCDPSVAVAGLISGTVTLDEINRQAHEHIENAESVGGQAYRSEAAVTDPKELVSLLGPEEEAPVDLCGCIEGQVICAFHDPRHP